MDPGRASGKCPEGVSAGSIFQRQLVSQKQRARSVGIADAHSGHRDEQTEIWL